MKIFIFYLASKQEAFSIKERKHEDGEGRSGNNITCHIRDD